MNLAELTANTILIVDDKPENIDLLTALLERVGVDLFIAQSGPETLELLKHIHPDLILLDVMMPGMDGFEVCRQMKMSATLQDIPVIFISALTDTLDKIKGFELGAVDYITKPFQAEEVLARIRTHLTICHLQNTLQHANQALQERTHDLEAANRELSNFAYIVAHDLKAPLRGIGQIAHWLVDDYIGAIDPSGQELIGLLMRRIKRLDGLIDGILTYAQIRRKKSGDQLLDLTLLVQESIAQLRPADTIQILLGTPFPKITGQKTHFSHIFQHLIGNAIQYLDKPDGRIHISCEDGAASWIFHITDNGPGIEPRYHTKIFQIFQTLRPRDEYESIGIGLALVKKIVELYGGRIWLTSQVGAGTTFSFTIPKTNTARTSAALAC